METNGSRNGSAHPPTEVPRRKLLGWLVGVINLGVLAAAVGPTLGFIADPLRRKRAPGIWVPVTDASTLALGETRSFTYAMDVEDGYMMSKRRYSVFLSRKWNGVVAYDPTCPHLGCHVEFKERKRRFVCPCHGGVFDEDGARVSGPPPKGLTRLETKVESGRIWVKREVRNA